MPCWGGQHQVLACVALFVFPVYAIGATFFVPLAMANSDGVTISEGPRGGRGLLLQPVSRHLFQSMIAVLIP